jgi:phosphatidylinositol-3,4,5-trisphosphate 3-phosphatase/dual-specificity protein phosphatase PTEN
MSDIQLNDPDITFFIHCKAGRGRSGMVLVAYQLYTHAVSSAAGAIAEANFKRSPDGLGISVPSQARFLRYFESICQFGYPPHRKIQLFLIVLEPGLNRTLEYVVSLGIPFEDPDRVRTSFDGNAISLNLVLEGEFFLRIWEPGADTDVIRMQLHADFLTDRTEKVEKRENGESVAVFGKYEIEGPYHRKAGKKFPEDFRISLFFLDI